MFELPSNWLDFISSISCSKFWVFPLIQDFSIKESNEFSGEEEETLSCWWIMFIFWSP